MPEKPRFRALAVLDPGEQLVPDMQHLSSAIRSTMLLGGQIVRIDSLWAPRPANISFVNDHVDDYERISPETLDNEKALELAGIELARYDLPADNLSRREFAMRSALKAGNPNITPEVSRSILAGRFQVVGAIAVMSGTLLGVNTAAGFYHELKWPT